MMFSNTSKVSTAIIIIAALLVSQMSIDLYLPSLPSMVNYFGTRNAYAQMTLSLFLLGYVVAQPLYGTCSDQFGRKPILLTGIIIAIISGLFCTFTTSLAVLLIARFTQGFGAVACNTMWRAALHDIYKGPSFTRALSFSSMCWILIPVIAPLLGGYIEHYLGWRFNFGLLTLLFGMLFLIIIFFFPETLPIEQRVKSEIEHQIKAYKAVLQTPQFIAYVLCWSILGILIFGFLVAAPFLFQVKLQINPIVYGWTVFFIASGYILGLLLNIYVSKNSTTLKKMFVIGLWGVLIVNIVFLLLALSGLFNFFVIVLPMFIMFFLLGNIFPFCISNALSVFTINVGIASALWGITIFAFYFAGTTLVAYLPENSLEPLALTFVVCSILGLVIYYNLILPLLRTQDKVTSDSQSN